MYDLAFVHAPDARWRSIANHVVSTLGLPQVLVASAGSTLPSSVTAALIFGPAGYTVALPQTVETWVFSALSPSVFNARPAAVQRGGGTQGDSAVVERRLVPISAASGPRGVLDQRLFWSLERLRKGGALLAEAELLEWLLWLALTPVLPNRADRLAETVVEALSRRSPQPTPLVALTGCAPDDWENALNALIKIKATTLWSEFSGDSMEYAKAQRKWFLRKPVLLVLLLMGESLLPRASHGDAVAEVSEKMKDMLEHSATAARLCAVRVAAALCGEEQIAHEAQEKMTALGLRSHQTALLRPAEGAKGYFYSPLGLLDAQLDLNAAAGLPEGCGQGAVEVLDLSALAMRPGVLRQGLLDRQLLATWERVHSAPGLRGHAYRLSKASYGQQVSVLESSWCSALRSMLAPLPLLSLNPRPAGCATVVSLRYDVDRPVSSLRIEEILAQQKRLFGKQAGSWYYFTDAPDRETQQSLLEANGQEVGLHLRSAKESLAGLGTTHHSSADSDYWTGVDMVQALAERNASYGEFLGIQTRLPRPMLSELTPPDSSFWLTPISFPLEGSTADSNLDYFDLLAEDFANQLSAGGHTIIGTHPDLDQSLLDQLVARGELGDCWFAPVGEIVDRYRSLRQQGAVAASVVSPGVVCLKVMRNVPAFSLELQGKASATTIGRWEKLTAGSELYVEFQAESI